MKKCKIIGLKKVGIVNTFNLTMKSRQHNYALFDAFHDRNFVISRNSCAYGYLSFQTAYLKANFPDEFACGHLNTFVKRGGQKDWEHVEMMEKECQKNLNIKLLPRTISECDFTYKIVRKKDPSKGIMQTEIRPSLLCKGVGHKAAQNIADNRPYKNVEDLAIKTDTKYVTSEIIAAYADMGYFGGKTGQRKKDEIVQQFDLTRKGIKAAKAKGVDPTTSIFD